jgi:TolB-like protein/DNA-binding winged helix-turn-helix (wHTH) protein
MFVSSKSTRFRFGAFIADFRAYELTKHGIRLKLQDQPFQILKLLLERSGELVSREELRITLWTESTFVDFDAGLNAAIRRLRDVLNDSAESPRYVETVPRHGYRFIAEVERLPEQAAPTVGKNESPASEAASSVVTGGTKNARLTALLPDYQSATSTTGLRSLWLAILAGAVLLVLLLGLRVESWRKRLLVSHASPKIRSIAVLPLQNLSGDPAQEFFADGMTDALITDLAHIGSLRVISRNSMIRYKGTQKSIPEIAKELNVDAIIEGSVIEADGRVRITAQLLQAFPEQHLWAQSYDRNLRDVLSLQSKVAQEIAAQVRATLTPEENLQLSRTKSVSPEAYEAFLLGRYFNAGGAPDAENKAIPQLRRAIQLDPDFVPAYTELASIYCFTGELEGGPEDRKMAGEFIQKALELDPHSAEAHTMLGCLYLRQDWDFVRGEAELRKAVNLEPGSSIAREWLATYLWNTNQLTDASTEIQAARALDPLSLKINGTIGLILYSQRRYDEAVKQFKKTLEMNPRFLMAHRHLLRVYDQMGEIPQALEEYVAAAPWLGIPPEKANEQLRILENAYKTFGTEAYWNKRIELEEQRAAEEFPDPAKRTSFSLAELLARRGHKDRAILLLNRLYVQRSDGLIMWLKSNPAFDSLRDDPRFQDLVRRVGFPPDTPSGISQ